MTGTKKKDISKLLESNQEMPLWGVQWKQKVDDRWQEWEVFEAFCSAYINISGIRSSVPLMTCVIVEANM